MPDYLSPPSSLPSGSSVWAYLRDSGGPTQGDSISRQRSEIESYCTRHGLRLAHIFFDEARSGGSTDGRDGFDELVSLSARPEHADGLLLWDYARLARNLDDSGYFKALLRRNGLVIHSLTDQIPEGPFSRVVEVIIDIGNEEKRRQVSRDTRSGLVRIVEQWGAMPGQIPVGYKGEPVDAGLRRDGTPRILHRWVPDPEMAPRVLWAFELRAHGATLYEVQKQTNLFNSRNSYPTFFCNAVYKGEFWFSGKCYPCEPIVSPELWDAVQKLGELRGRSRYAPQHRRVHSPYLLSGLARCQECGAPLSAYEIFERKYYSCSRAKRRGDCSARYIQARRLEEGIIARLLEDVLSLDNLLRVQAAWMEESRRWVDDIETQRHERTRGLRSVQTKISNLTAAIAESGPTRALLESLDQVERERDLLEYEFEQMSTIHPVEEIPPPRMAELANAIRAGLQGEPDECRNALRAIIKSVLVRRADDCILASLEYQPLKENSLSDGRELVSNTVGGPDGNNTILLTIPIPKYKLSNRP